MMRHEDPVVSGPSLVPAPPASVRSGTSRPDPRPGGAARPEVRGRSFYVGDQKLWARGATYGTFLPAAAGDDGYDPAAADEDFAMMSAAGLNAVRLYDVPPTWLLDAAQRHGLWVAIDVPWEQHVTFLDDPSLRSSIETRVRDGVRRCAGHPAILSFSIGNEIPSRIVRWHGPRRIEDFLERLADAAHAADDAALVTYVNYPTTEYLRVRGIDFDAWNVYLERNADFERYVTRLQNLSIDRPVVIAELGADSRRLGEATQAELLEGQVRAAFSAGSAGTFVFAWTDDWARTGIPVTDWDFGLTTRDRRPKAALAAVATAYRDVPLPRDVTWPRISVVVCSFNGSRVIRRCLEGLAGQDYPDYEVIVVDDGSTDDTAAIAEQFDVVLIRTSNRGLSAARNEGLARASGEIVAYIDDDAWPDRDWLSYLGWTFATTDHAAVGGPNLPPPGDGRTADLVALAPGGPNHVLRTDTEAEHVPGCNSSFRVDRLRAIEGYDTRFRTAGDDVDVCWRLHDRGWTVGFSPGAVVWHHRRGTTRGYLRQQRGYGFAEALLERKWPGRFNRLGHVAWPGQLYGSGARPGPLAITSVYGGTWGSAPYQSIYERSSHWIAAPLMPEWWLAIAGLLGLGALGLSWSPLLVALALAIAMTGASVLVGLAIAADALDRRRLSPMEWARRLVQLELLIIGQSLARFRGRLAGGLTPWRRRGAAPWGPPRASRHEEWTEDWQAMEARLRRVEGSLVAAGFAVERGGATDRWDLEIRGGAFGGARLLGTIEEHGQGRQLVRWLARPRVWMGSVVAVLGLLGLGAMAAIDGRGLPAAALAAVAAIIIVRTVVDAGRSVAALVDATGLPREHR
jgi:glycosyltransferase involved in cell wall biosynthesis